ncbi:uncharacterized protein BCR38DRAFT_387461 [Pseudomassariella vexata]|uniref:Tat pathway signal sequence n=1 Tax=Pseudomassariella vexata TaxID=1141098 RepID=A0A1Y2E6Y6_9PEZI|nr:uncharacterized protein BCR38DRAFT_387461 [Pseudomassariella vexata]ORY67104.1 hypothetical protein BCR38DRAFT_387461 [Pseudomassariella vexata]
MKAAPAYADDVRYQQHFEIFQAAFWQKTPFKGPPTPEILEKWEHITTHPVLNLTAEEVTSQGLSIDSAQYPKSLGGGYMGYVESSHQLHCLHTLWATKHLIKYPELFPNMLAKQQEDPELEDAHFEHCVDVVRQRLMCTADPAIVTFQWIMGLPRPYPNFHTGHMCTDYGALRDWTDRRAADLDKLEG